MTATKPDRALRALMWAQGWRFVARYGWWEKRPGWTRSER